MLSLVALGVLAGLLTSVSPCVLPLLPVIFFAGSPVAMPGPDAAGSDAVGGGPAPERRSRARPAAIIAGLVVSFSLITLTGSLMLSALGLPADVLRWAGLVVLVLVGMSLLVPRVEELVQRPFARFARNRRGALGGNGFVLGLGLGTLYVPCAGPVLAAIAVAGATGRIGGQTVVLSLAFAVGAAIPLFFFAAAGQAIGRRLAGYRRRARAFRVTGGVLMIGLAVALAFGLTDAVQRSLPDYTAALQTTVEDNPSAREVLAALKSAPQVALDVCPAGQLTPADCGPAPALAGISHWFNTQDNRPLSLDELRGKVVIVDFWTYSCINCQRAVPHVQAWYSAYESAGLQVVGVHTPEFAFEKEQDNVAEGVADQHVTYPVAMDNAGRTWTNYHNRYWPALYLIDAQGIVRHVRFGEGGYDDTESLIRQLLVAADPTVELPARIEG